MKLSDDASFPRPLLRPGVRDWLEGSFGCELSVSEVVSAGTVRLEGKICLEQQYVRAEVESGNVDCGVYVTCLDTMFSSLYCVGLRPFQIHLASGQVRGTVIARPVVFATARPVALPQGEITAEFGQDDLTVDPCEILGYGAEHRFEAGYDKLVPMESVFRLISDETISEPRFELVCEGQAAEIHVSPALYAQIVQLRESGSARNVLLSCLYLPALFELVCLAVDQPRPDLRWYQAIELRCRQIGLEIDDGDRCRLVQRLLGHPLGLLHKALEDLSK